MKIHIAKYKSNIPRCITQNKNLLVSINCFMDDSFGDDSCLSSALILP
ncbi:hypothetical protein Hanom_Chr14g01270021 [Helianthus anomalus]